MSTGSIYAKVIGYHGRYILQLRRYISGSKWEDVQHKVLMDTFNSFDAARQAAMDNNWRVVLHWRQAILPPGVKTIPLNPSMQRDKGVGSK